MWIIRQKSKTISDGSPDLQCKIDHDYMLVRGPWTCLETFISFMELNSHGRARTVTGLSL